MCPYASDVCCVVCDVYVVSATIPKRFLAACKGDTTKALAKWNACKAWRAKHDIDHILTRPYPKWDVIKKCYPQAIHGRGLKGEPLSIETPGAHTTQHILHIPPPLACVFPF
jgi:hypothetical protein